MLTLNRVATEEELLPVSHLLPGQASEVPSHVRVHLEAALHAVPLSDYSPLDHHSGAFDKISVSPPCLASCACFSQRHHTVSRYQCSEMS